VPLPPSDEPLRFDRYQERCLYDPEAGFYAGLGRAGRRDGDFITSPEVGPLFGATLARGLDRWWRELGEPRCFDVVEAGAGRGALAVAILAADPDCAEAMHYTVVERSASLRADAAELLGDRAGVLAEMPDQVDHGVVIANELLDNVAVRVVEFTGDGWLELYVDDDGPTLRPSELHPRWDVPVGTRLPVPEAASAWVDDARRRVGRGRVVCIDYGVRKTIELSGRAFLRTYRAHERGTDPFADPGRRDITCDVAFDQLPPADELRSQADFLADLGIDALVEEGRVIWSERAAIGDLAAVRGRSRIIEAEALTDPGGLGAFLVAEWIV
jgi:SAM-dependent MidA family methyltransferase